MTVEEFRRLPQGHGGVCYELRHGELVSMTRPKLKHTLIQHNLCNLLRLFAEPEGFVDVEVPFRPLAEHELWAADVGYISKERLREADPEDNIHGAPEIVIEVLSPSNTASEIRDKRKLCLENGSVEFWVADPDQREVEVWTPDGRSVTYTAAQQIPLFFAPGSAVSVAAIYE